MFLTEREQNWFTPLTIYDLPRFMIPHIYVSCLDSLAYTRIGLWLCEHGVKVWIWDFFRSDNIAYLAMEVSTLAFESHLMDIIFSRKVYPYDIVVLVP
jgi:hypothetical protein